MRFTTTIFLFFLLFAGTFNSCTWNLMLQYPLLILLSLTNTVFLAEYFLKNQRSYLLLSIICFLLIFILILSKNGLDHTLLTPTNEEIHYLNQRFSYYPFSLGRVFQNKGVLFLHKLSTNIFESIDLNFYFFASHPRERVGVHESSRYSAILLPFFIIGLFGFLKAKPRVSIIITILLVLLLNSLVKTSSPFASFIFSPLINLTIASGLMDVIFRKKASNE